MLLSLSLLFFIISLLDISTCSLLIERDDVASLPGALSEIPLENGMSVVAQFIQYSDYLTYALYLNNQVRYPYWNSTTNSNLCLAWVVGTPSLLVDSTHQCSFLQKNNNQTSGDTCIPTISQNPCTTPINTSQCNSVELFSGSVSLQSTNYSGLTSIVSINSTNTQIYPKAGNSISGRSILISFTNATQQENTCSNIRLGYGTIGNFTYAQDNNGTFVLDYPQTSHSDRLFRIDYYFFFVIVVIVTVYCL